MSSNKLILYTVDLSPPGRCVMLTAAALGLDLEVKRIDFFGGEHLTPAFKKMNPLHTVPLLDDNGLYVYDSHAIATYLISQYGPKDCPLYPSCPKKRALIDQKLHFDSGILFARHRLLTGPFIYNGAKVLKGDGILKVFEAYDFMETFLSNSKWLAGDDMTVADLSCLSSITTMEVVVPIRLEKYPNIHAWLNRCKALPYYQKINQVGVEAFEEMYFSQIKP